jgi:hypothetical protein
MESSKQSQFIFTKGIDKEEDSLLLSRRPGESYYYLESPYSTIDISMSFFASMSTSTALGYKEQYGVIFDIIK